MSESGDGLREDPRGLLAAPLAQLRVLEVCDHAAGQYAGRLLAHLGADVIRVEDPASPGLRAEPPLLSDDPPEGALAVYLSAGKRSVTLRRDGEVAHRLRAELASRCDAVIDDRPLAEREAVGENGEFFLGLSPRLIYLSVLPFGAVGPYSRYQGEEINLFHGAGEGNLLPNGLGHEMFPDREPLKAYGHLGELQAGVGAAAGLMAALYVRDLVGGQSVDVSVQDVNVALGGFNLQRYGDGTLERRQTRSFTYGGVLECADGYVQVLVLEQHQWEELVVMLGSPSWALREEYADPVQRAAHGKEINRQLRAWAKTRTVDEVVELARKYRIPLDRYSTPGAILRSEHEQARNFLTDFELPDGRAATMPNLPFKLLPAHALAPLSARAPVAGQDNMLVYTDYLSHSPDEVSHWLAEGVI
jgi:crotonobetainyl-CoA:carnitine CoA-transferase CaiB-like acyl-CoA transferase